MEVVVVRRDWCSRPIKGVAVSHRVGVGVRGSGNFDGGLTDLTGFDVGPRGGFRFG